MNYVETSASLVTHAQNPEGLRGFEHPSCPAAIWYRKFTPEFQQWIDAQSPAHLPQGRVVLPRNSVAQTVEKLCEILQTPPSAERNMLINDIVALSEIFADLMGAEYLRVRLDKVTTNACRKFHIDALTARLVCTYRGMGTQFGTAPAGHEPSQITTVPTGSPILLRGTLWPTEPPANFLHRSPPIEGTGETRLVLVIDPVSDPEGET